MASRIDQISVQCYPFDRSHNDEQLAAMKASEKREFWMAIVEKLFIGILVVLAFLFLRSVVKKSQKIAQQMLPPTPLPRPTAALDASKKAAQIAEKARAELVIPDLEEPTNVESIKRQEIHRRVKGYASEKPREATQLIRSWMFEEPHAAKD